ncbi:MAG: LamG-like jellyroll fold domain-containing protein [Planctomycetaceae bacterium]|nr:LamG domain-containing protein [Planctomycetaceae bacterium]
MKRTALTILAMAAVLALAPVVQAATVTQALWKMGEDDPAAAAGNAVNATGVDSSGSNDLALLGSGATYTAPGADTGSPLAVNFDGAGHYEGTVAGWAGDRGVELWLRISEPNDRHDPLSVGNLIFYTFGGGSNQIYNDFAGTGGVGDPFTYTSSEWFHLALVTVGLETTFYANGVAQGSSREVTFDSDLFVVGDTNRGGGPWLGDIDNVRVFNVTDGDFDPMRDLTLSMDIPEPATMSLLALGGLAALIRRKRQ